MHLYEDNDHASSVATFQRKPSRNETTVSDRKSWRIALALSAGVCQQILCWGLIMTYGAILSYYEHTLLPKTSKILLLVAGSIPPFLLLALALVWGRLLDAGYHRLLNLFAGICLTTGLTGLAFTTHSKSGQEYGKLWQTMLASTLIGIGQSVYFLAAPHMAKTWWPERRGLAMGITNSGAAIGGSIWPLLFEALTFKYNFRTGVCIIAGISAALAIFIICFSVPASCVATRPLPNRHAPSKVTTWIPTRAFRSRTFVLQMLAMCVVYLGTLTAPFLIESWAEYRQIGIRTSPQQKKGVLSGDGPFRVYLIVIMNACQLPGRLFGSTLCDLYSARTLHATVCMVASLLTATFWTLARSFTTACLFSGLFGLTLGVMVSLPINDVTELLGKSRSHYIGQYAGLMYTVSSPFIISGTIISGVIAEQSNVVRSGIFMAGVFLAGAVLIIIGRAMKDDTWKFDQPASPPASDEEC